MELNCSLVTEEWTELNPQLCKNEKSYFKTLEKYLLQSQKELLKYQKEKANETWVVSESC